jgi:hypothetical protein
LRWWIGALLFASTVINKADRQTLSLLSIPETALPPDEFGLSLVGYFSDANQSLATHSFDTIIIVAGLVPFIGMIFVLCLVRNSNETGLVREIAEDEAGADHLSRRI